MERQLIIENVTSNELLDLLDSRIRLIVSEIKKDADTPPTSEYLTRQEVADYFGITLPTVHQWTVIGILLAYKVANRVYYKRKEVESAYTQKSIRGNLVR